MKNHFSIIGAGIGGLATAITLKQKGFTFSVYEAAAEIKPVGAGIILANNAMQVMKKLGLQHKLEQAGNRISEMRITDQHLKPLSVVDLSPFEKKHQVSNLAIHRGLLQQILAEETGYQNIHLAKQLLEVKADKVYQLRFADNSTAEAEILIGADGIKSPVRTQLFNHGTIRNAGQICWRGTCEMDLPAHYHHQLNEAWGKGKRFGFVKIGPRKVYWYALAQAKKHNAETNLITLFKDFHPDILTILEATASNNIITSPITDLKPIKTWQLNNVCLIGDAAHATTPNLGQGACQAIEDAYVLGNCLDLQNDIPTSFKNYEKLRIRKAHAIVNTSWQIGKLAHIDSDAGVWLRNNFMKYMPKVANRRQMEMIFELGIN